MADPSQQHPGRVGGTRVKICGLTRRKDAVRAAEAGADFLGVVLVGDSPRGLSPGEAGVVVRGLDLPVVAVAADLSPEEAAAAAETVGASILQLHGNETPDEVARLGELGDWELWKALRVRDAGEVKEGLASFSETVTGLLLDGWHPIQKGGTGSPFPWEAVAGVRDLFPPGLLFIAAGGLTPENVGRAISGLRPHVVDVSSGVEREPGIKDHSRIFDFIRAAREPGLKEDW